MSSLNLDVNLNVFFFIVSLTAILFLKFSIVLSCTALSDLCNHFFSASILFYMLSSAYGSCNYLEHLRSTSKTEPLELLLLYLFGLNLLGSIYLNSPVGRNLDIRV